MPIFELFSKRQKKLSGLVSDVYRYDNISQNFRTQVILITKDTIGDEEKSARGCSTIYQEIYKTLCKEYGVFRLGRENLHSLSIFDFFINSATDEQCLDIIDLIFSTISNLPGSYRFNVQRVDQDSKDAVKELNYRFKEAGLGYQFESGELMRIDSQYIHAEVVKPALALLGQDPCYAGANDEFLSAHEHYRHQRYKECLVDCSKSFESLIKAIHDKHSWHYEKHYTASKLIASCLTNQLIPSYMQSQFSSFQSLLESRRTWTRLTGCICT